MTKNQEPKVPVAKYGSSKTPLKITDDISIDCYVLDNGLRVLSGRGMQRALNISNERGTELARTLGDKNLLPFTKDILEVIGSSRVEFRRPDAGGAQEKTYGYEATILVTVCDALLQARKGGKLSKEQLELAERAEILTRAFAKVGIIALIDEATGYQNVRERDELQKILAAYIAEELLPWQKRFPDEYYYQIYRLKGWTMNLTNINRRTPLVGKITNEVVYKLLPNGVLDELRRLNPKDDAGIRKHKHHQFLSGDIGNPHLEKHLAAIITLMRISENWDDFEEKLIKAFPNYIFAGTMFERENSEMFSDKLKFDNAIKRASPPVQVIAQKSE